MRRKIYFILSSWMNKTCKFLLSEYIGGLTGFFLHYVENVKCNTIAKIEYHMLAIYLILILLVQKKYEILANNIINLAIAIVQCLA